MAVTHSMPRIMRVIREPVTERSMSRQTRCHSQTKATFVGGTWWP